MDDYGRQARGQNNEALMRTVALLLALADLAERAAGRSRPVRFLVLWILHPAEVAARRFVIEVLQDLALTEPEFMALEALAAIPVVRGGGSSSDVIGLALRFRALAAALDGLPPLQESRFALAGEALAQNLYDVFNTLRPLEIGHMPVANMRAAVAPALNDTS